MRYSTLPSIRTVPVSGHLKQKVNFCSALFSSRWTKYFEWKLNISALRWKFWRFESLRNSRGRRRSVQVSKLFMANTYDVYCAIKLALLRKGRVMCDIFKETLLFLNWRYLRKSSFQKVYSFFLKFDLFAITEARNIHLVLMSCAQYPDSFFFAVQNRWIICVHYPDKIYLISVTIIKA